MKCTYYCQTTIGMLTDIRIHVSSFTTQMTTRSCRHDKKEE